MKILCVCRAGVVRSVALSKILRELFGHDAVPVSSKFNSLETLTLLFNWADKIIFVDPALRKGLPDKFSRKAITIMIPDSWHDATHPELIDLIYRELRLVREVTHA